MELVQYLSLCLCVYLPINIKYKVDHSFVIRINDPRGNLRLTSGCRLCKDDITEKTWIFLNMNRFLKTKESEKGALYEKRFLHSKNYNIHPVIELTI